MTFWDFLNNHPFLGGAMVCFVAFCAMAAVSDAAQYLSRLGKR